MERMKDRFCTTSDKEITLQTLITNNIPSIELLDAKTCSYPIVGRKYGHHQGKDLTIIHTQVQALEEGLDYFTKLYMIEKEYLMEIEALSVKSFQEAEAHQLVFHEIPIRTELYGWGWKEADPSSIPKDWLNMSIRALYVTGLTSGLVKIGKLSDDSAIVLDIHSSLKPLSIPGHVHKLPFTIGADIEFMLSCENELLPASNFFPLEGPVGCDERQIEQDSGEYALAEIRPEKAQTPHELVSNIKKLLFDASEMAPYENVEFRAGSMPFSGYQCGGHIHFGLPVSLSFLRVLDQYLAIPLAMIEDSHTARRRRKTKHGGLGRYREKPYGFEYLSLSSWIIDPDLTLAVLCLSYLVAAHQHELPCDFLFQPLVQRAYYQGNQIYLKQFWDHIKKQLLKTSSYLQYEKELSVLFERIENANAIKESSDLRKNWGFQATKHYYDQGMIIQIPKKTRIKFNLSEGQRIQVRAGKSMAMATIRSYPFSFLNSNRVHPSPSLREILSMPKEWCPKICTAKGVLTLGPIIGILASRPFERQSTYFQHLFRLSKEKQMLVYVFEPQDINWDEKVIRGTSIYGDGFFPFPAVIYDRYFFTDVEENQALNDLRFKLQSVYDIPFINPPVLFQITGDKWESHQILSKTLLDYLPQTRILKSLSDISEMLDRYGEVFLKPLSGSFSRGVIQVVRRPSGIFWISSGQRTFQKLTMMEELIPKISALQEMEPYLVQEGIRRKQLGGNHVEIRVYMQKNGNQKWVRTGMVTRLTNVGVLTEDTETNKRSSYVLAKLFPNPTERHQVRSQLAAVTRSVVTTVEEHVGTFGELAVDLCIDHYNSIKILEINAKPDNLFSQIKAYKLRNLAGLRLLNYAASLAGYESEEI